MIRVRSETRNQHSEIVKILASEGLCPTQRHYASLGLHQRPAMGVCHERKCFFFSLWGRNDPLYFVVLMVAPTQFLGFRHLSAIILPSESALAEIREFFRKPIAEILMRPRAHGVRNATCHAC